MMTRPIWLTLMLVDGEGWCGLAAASTTVSAYCRAISASWVGA